MKNFIIESEIEQIALDILSEDLGFQAIKARFAKFDETQKKRTDEEKRKSGKL